MTILVIGLALVYAYSPADLAADDGCLTPHTCVNAAEGNIRIDKIGRRRDVGPAGSPGRRQPPGPATDPTAAFCADASANAAAAGGAPRAIVEICAPLGPMPVAPSREEVLTAFRELPLYKGAIRTDPAAFTLVNLDTYFWCADGAGRGCGAIGEAERRVTLLGQPVRIQPKIMSYTWSFGDGTGQEISGGKAAHTYRHAGRVTVTLTLTWTADYALGAGGFQPIDDTTTTTSPIRVLPVREAQTVIVGDG